MARTPDVHRPEAAPTVIGRPRSTRPGLRHIGVLFVGTTVADRLAYAGFLMVLAWGLGVSGDADLFFVVTSLPMTLAGLLADVCFAVITRAMAGAHDDAERWALAGRALRVFALLYGVPALAIALAAAPLVTVLAPGLSPALVAHAGLLQAWAALLLPGYGLATVAGTILMASGHVAAGAIRAPLVSLTTVVAAVLASLILGPSVEGLLAVSIVAPVLVAAGLFRQVMRCKGRHALDLLGRGSLGDDRTVIRAALLATCPNLTQAAVLLIERAIGSTLGSGAVTVLAIGRTIAPLVGAVPAAVGNAGFLDALSKRPSKPHEVCPQNAGLSKPLEVCAHRDPKQACLAPAVADPTASSRLILYASLLTAIPIAVIMFGETSTVMTLFFQRGRFGPEDTLLVSQVALAFGVGWLHFVLGGSLQRVCQLVRLDGAYALLCLTGLVVYGPTALTLTAWLGLPGLALSYGMTMTLIAVAAAALAAGRLGWCLLRLPYGRLALIAVIGTLVLVAVRPELALLPGTLCRLAAAGILSVLTVVATAWLVDLPGVRPAWRRLAERSA